MVRLSNCPPCIREEEYNCEMKDRTSTNLLAMISQQEQHAAQVRLPKGLLASQCGVRSSEYADLFWSLGFRLPEKAFWKPYPLSSLDGCPSYFWCHFSWPYLTCLWTPSVFPLD